MQEERERIVTNPVVEPNEATKRLNALAEAEYLQRLRDEFSAQAMQAQTAKAEATYLERLRDEFAANAMQGLFCDTSVLYAMSRGPRGEVQELAIVAYEIADAMLEARKGKS